MRLPKGAVRGNYIPVYSLEMGCRFPEGVQRETASHSGPEKWDMVSGWHEKSPHSSYELRGLMRCGVVPGCQIYSSSNAPVYSW